MSSFAAPTPASQPLTPPADAPAKFTEEPVVWLHRWNDGLMSFRIRRDPAYAFTPGQFARIGLRKANGDVIWRAYSIVSAPDEAFLEFFLVVVPTGEFSSRVSQLAVGDRMLVEKQAQGFLTADRFKDGRDLWLLGTGTGLAPYISMLRDHTVLIRSHKTNGNVGVPADEIFRRLRYTQLDFQFRLFCQQHRQPLRQNMYAKCLAGRHSNRAGNTFGCAGKAVLSPTHQCFDATGDARTMHE